MLNFVSSFHKFVYNTREWKIIHKCLETISFSFSLVLSHTLINTNIISLTPLLNNSIAYSHLSFPFSFKYSHTFARVHLYKNSGALNIFFYFPRFLIDPKQFDTPYYVLNFRNLILLLQLSIYKSSVCTTILIMLHL